MLIASAMAPTLYIALVLEPLVVSCSMVWPATMRSAPTVGLVSTLSPYRTTRLLTRTIRTNRVTRRASPTSLKSKVRDSIDRVRLTSPTCLGERLGSLDLTTDGTLLPNGENMTAEVLQRDDVSPADIDSPATFLGDFNESGHPHFQDVTLAALTLALAALLAPPDAIAASTTSVELVVQTSASAASVDVAAIFAKAGKASVGGGASGAAAAVVQVLSLMWLRTAMNFQYKNGGSTQNAIQTLWQEGGIPRFYRGLPFALIQGPLSRFGDTAANVGVLALLEAFESTRSLPLPIKSAAGSLAAGAWRIGLTPIDTYKTTLQVAGAEGTALLADKVAANGPGVLFEGALATATATFVGHYPWYLTYNALGTSLPQAPGGDPLLKLVRQAFLGLCSSCVSDCCSNSIRVLKTTKQTAPDPISYPEALKQVIDKDGVVAGLLLRGLQTRILVNALQGALFAVAWKYFQELIRANGGM